MNPEEANTKKCKVVKVIYNYDNFSYAYLYIVDENKNTLGCRWNYNYGTNNDIGSPNQGNNPKWLYLPESLYMQILNTIGGLAGTIEQNRIDVLQAINNGTIIRPETEK